jgi:hypothetical protein
MCEHEEKASGCEDMRIRTGECEDKMRTQGKGFRMRGHEDKEGRM